MKTLNCLFQICLLLLMYFGLALSQDYWSKLNGPYGGIVLDLKNHPNGNLFALRSNAVFESSNNGEIWNKIPQGSVNTNLCMDISQSGIIYVGKSSGGIWWSTNTGQTWSFNPVHIAPHSGQWSTVILVKVNSLGHVYINNHVSLNGGFNFTAFEIGGSSILSRDYAFNNSNHVYSATQNGIYFSVNNASSWTNINGNLPSSNTTSIMFDNDILLTGLNGNGVYRTSNNGITWTELNNGITDLNVNKIYKDGENNYYAATVSGKVFKSINQGQAWAQIYFSQQGGAVNSIYATQNSIYLTTSNLGILKSQDNGLTWNEKNVNLQVAAINSLAFSDNHEIFASSTFGLYYSSNDGTAWQKKGNSLPSSIINSVFRNTNGDLFAGIRNFGIYRSTDNGDSWLPSNNGLFTQGNFSFIRKSPSGFMFAVSIPVPFSDTMRVYRSSDNGLNWVKVFQPNSPGFDKFVMDASGRLFIAGLGSNFQITILRSTDNGITWDENVLEEFFVINNFINSGNSLYMSISDKLYKSTDLGTTWNLINTPVWQPPAISALAVNSRGHIFASAGSQVFVTTNSGNFWALQNSGITPFVQIINFIFDNNEYLYGISFYDGIFRSVQSTITSIESTNIIPEKFRLYQNYPNPFNPKTIISYEIPETALNGGLVLLTVYDVLGNEVATLINQRQQPGNYEIEFDGTGYSSGTYFYKLSVEDFSDTKRMILIK